MGEAVLRKFFHKSIPGKAYYFHYHPSSHFDAYVETATGFKAVEVKQAAIDCGVPDLRQSDPTKDTQWYGEVLLDRDFFP